MFENRRFLIINTEDLTQVDFDQVLESSINTVRKTIDGLKTFIKYDVDTETGTYGRPDLYTEDMVELTHSEMLKLLSTDEWLDPVINEEETGEV